MALPDGHYYAAFHASATEIVDAQTPDEVLEDLIPTTICMFQKKRHWDGWGSPETTKKALHGPIEEWKGKRLLMTTDTPSPLPAARPESQKAETVGEQIDSLRAECRYTVEELAEKLGIQPRSVYRHLSGEAIPRKPHLGAYERVFSERLGRKVFIIQTSGKRQ